MAVKARRALVSTSDRTALAEFVIGLDSLGIQIVSTGGTGAYIREAGIDVTDVADITGFPEIMDGRIKTLHPRIHGGLLAVRDNPAHMATIAEHDIEPIDLVCVNLYDGKLHHLGDAMLKNQAHFDVEDPASLTALLLGVGSGVAVSFASLPVTIGILLFSMVLYWHESHYMSLSAIVARTNSEFAQRLSQDATIHAYDCHTIATAPHPSKHGHTQRFVKPLEECLAKKTKDMHRLQQGIVPAIPVMPKK